MDISSEIGLLNPPQREAVMETEGPLLILAGAGSGKTRVITLRAAFMIHSGVEPTSIVALTFTNKAAREMQERIARLVSLPRGKGPVISTFHSLCLRILRREAEHLGYRRDFVIYGTGEQLSLIRNILSEVKHADRSFKAEDVLERISGYKNLEREPIEYTATRSEIEEGAEDRALPEEEENTGGKPPASTPPTNYELEAFSSLVYPRYLETMRALNAVDFDDLLTLTIKLFKEHPEVLEKYHRKFRYLMVDEYQDTNRIQYEFIRLFAGGEGNICVVGDDDQSIYGWRGADIRNILDFEKDFPGARIVKLEQNYRSFSNILETANHLISNNRARMEKTLWSALGQGPKVNVYKAPDGEEEARWTAERIGFLKYQRNLKWEDFAIIYRANLFSKPFEAALREARIPYTVFGGSSYFERKEVRDLAAYLKLIANPRDDLSLLRAANVPRRGLGPGAITKTAEYAREKGLTLLEAFREADGVEGLGGRAARAAEGFAELVDRYRERFEKGRGLEPALRNLLEEIGYTDHLYDVYKSPETATSRLEIVNEFARTLGLYEENSPAADFSLQSFLETLALTDMQDNNKEEGGGFGGVTLTSMHSAKGLEFPVVFVAGVEEEILPHKKSASHEAEVEEERRLFYVAITRAMKELHLTLTENRVKYGKRRESEPSRFLSELPEEFLYHMEPETLAPPEDEEAVVDSFRARIKEILGSGGGETSAGGERGGRR